MNNPTKTFVMASSYIPFWSRCCFMDFTVQQEWNYEVKSISLGLFGKKRENIHSWHEKSLSLQQLPSVTSDCVSVFLFLLFSRPFEWGFFFVNRCTEFSVSAHFLWLSSAWRTLEAKFSEFLEGDGAGCVSAVQDGSVAGYQGGCFAVFVKYWLRLATPHKRLQRREGSL